MYICFLGKLSCEDVFFRYHWGAHCYAVSDNSTYTQEVADSVCAALDSTLVVIETEAERDFMEDIIPAKYFMALYRESDFSHMWRDNGYKIPVSCVYLLSFNIQ